MGCLRNVCMHGVSDAFFLRDESIAPLIDKKEKGNSVKDIDRGDRNFRIK